MVKTASRVSNGAGVSHSRTVVHISAVPSSKANPTFTVVASIGTGTVAICTARGGATVVMWSGIGTSHALNGGGWTVPSIGFRKGTSNTSFSFTTFSETRIDNVLTVIAYAIVRAVALIVVTTKGKATCAIAFTLIGLTCIEIFCTVHSSFI